MPDIEHKEPKEVNLYPHRALHWDNFLFACHYCNSNKGTLDPRTPPLLFPDEANTACLFDYKESGFIDLSLHISGSIHKQAALDTRDLFLKLNRPFDVKGNRDLRWQHRLDVWREAKLAKEELDCCEAEEMRRRIVSSALGWGCFSIWMTVFASDADMCRRFIAEFPGTRTACFDAVTGAPINDLTL